MWNSPCCAVPQWTACHSVTLGAALAARRNGSTKLNLKRNEKMKKTLILAGVALVAALSACNKAEMPDNIPSEGIKLNISVADLSPETKAVKAGWVNGDKINLYFEGWNESATEADYQKEPDMILVRNGSKWQIESQVSSLSGRLKNSGGKFTAIWESSNDLMNYNINSWYSNSVWYDPLKTKTSYNSYQDAYHTPMCVYSAGIEYTFDGSTLTANISSWKFDCSKFKVLVKTDDAGLKAKASDMVLEVSIGDKFAPTRGAIVVDRQYFLSYPSIGSANNYGQQGAVAESDGLAFYYQSCDSAASDTIVFTLIDTGDGTKKQYSVTGKALKSDEYTFKAISIDYSKFTNAE